MTILLQNYVPQIHVLTSPAMHTGIGSRIKSDGHIATVLFVGEIPRTKGEWLGVEWDDPGRGKHNGCHEGVQYFLTKHPSSGSFIRPKKANFGVPFLQALRGRYGLVEGESAGVDVQEMFVLGGKNKHIHTTVEVVGAQSVNKQQSQFDKLLEISLRDAQVSNPGEPDQIRNTVPSVEELDLSRNLLSSWQSVSKITEQLPALRILKLSENKLAFPETPSQLHGAFATVRTAFFNRMNFTWDELMICTEMIQHLVELHACYNQIHTLSHTGSYLNNVHLINLEANDIESWNEILKLGNLPNLDSLILNNTNLDNIEFPDVRHGKTTKFFPKLHTLSISNNKISGWAPFNELNKLSQLTVLTFRRNPLLEQYPNAITPWSIVAAKLGHLKIANRSEITSIDRKGAELDYMRINGKYWRASGGHQDPTQNKPSEAFKLEHPRYQQLIEKYGPPEDSELKEQSTALKNSLISLLIASPNLPDKPAMKKKLPISMTVQKFKTLVQRIFKADPITMKITYTSLRMPGPEIEMDHDQKELDYYSIEEGDTIHISW